MAARSGLFGVLLAAGCLVMSGCAGPSARGKTQALLLETDPAGFTCTVARNGAVVATVEATPGAATVERRSDPIEVTCTREGYVEHRETLVSEIAANVERDEGVEEEPSTADQIIGGAAMGVTVSSAQAAAALSSATGPMAAAAAGVYGPAILLGLAVAPAYGIYQYYANPPYAIRRPPMMVMTPASFDSEAERDGFFAHRIAELEALAEKERVRAKKNCGGAYCAYLRAKIEAAQKVRLQTLDAERSQVAIGQR